MNGPVVKWYVSKYSDKVERKEFHRETEHMLFFYLRGRERREHKVTEWGCHYDDEAIAQAVVDASNARKAESLKLRRLEKAAPDLLDALRKYIAAGFGNSTDFYAQGLAYDAAVAAIAKATQP